MMTDPGERREARSISQRPFTWILPEAYSDRNRCRLGLTNEILTRVASETSQGRRGLVCCTRRMYVV